MRLEKRASFGWPASSAGSAPCRNGMVAHYDGSDQGLAGKSHTACRTYWKDTRNFHLGPERGWRDIGYSYGVCPHGVVMEGRGFGKEQAAQPGGNTTWTSCTFMTGDHERPTAVALEAWKEFRAWLRGKGVAAAVKGHRDFISTSCPGGPLYAMVKDGSLTGSPPGPTKVTAPGGTPALRSGSTGTRVEGLQRALNKATGAKLVVDGDFGAKTETAVLALQRRAKISADGVYGPDSAKALAKLL